MDSGEIQAARDCGHTWEEIAEAAGEGKEALRSRWRRGKDGAQPETCPLCGGQPGVRWEERGNEATASATTEEIQTLEQLLQVARVDLDKWKVRDWKVKAWGLGAKIKTGELDFDKGKISGNLKYHGLGKTTLFSVVAYLVRREPVAIEPVIQPIEAGIRVPLIELEPESEGIRRAILAADLHVGYRRDPRTGKLTPLGDRRAIDLFIQLVAANNPEYVGILGDSLDLTMWTDRFAREAEFYWTTQPALLELHYILRRVREAAPGARVIWFKGNHEIRMRKALEAHLLEACHLKPADELHLPPAMSPERLLALDQLGVGVVGSYPDGVDWLGPLMLKHGEVARTQPGGTAGAVVKGTDEPVAFGHIHRIETASRTVRTRAGRRSVMSHSFGCLCHTDGRVPGSKRGSNWQQGIAIVDYSKDRYNLTAVEIEDGTALYGAQRWTGVDYKDQLRSHYPDWNW